MAPSGRRSGRRCFWRPRGVASTLSSANWRAAIHTWVQAKRHLPNATSEDLIEFFERCFQCNRCPEQSWFGLHQDVISLVVGGLFLGAVHRKMVSLLVDQRFDDIPCIMFSPVKSTENWPGRAPLLWADLPLEHLTALAQLNHYKPLWASHARASRAVLAFPIAKPRDVMQRQRGKIRLPTLLGQDAEHQATDTMTPHTHLPNAMLDGINCDTFIAQLGTLNDIRKTPTAGRRNQFFTGWQDAATHRKTYTDTTLQRLTWRNLGYRLGQQLGEQSTEVIDQVYRKFADHHRTLQTATHIVPSYWETEVRNWIQCHRQIPADLSDPLITFFVQCFDYNRCPEHAWFGIFKQAVSLVVGQLYLGSIYLGGGPQDWGLWLLLDQAFDDISGMDCRIVKSTQKSDTPLIWGHLSELKQLAMLNDHAALWDSHGRASARILDFSIAHTRDEAFQRRQRRLRLADFWPTNAHNLPGVTKAVESEGHFDPRNLEDARHRIERSIVQRRGQHKFRQQLLHDYGSRCPISGCDLTDALDAAHIVPYQGENTHHRGNGLPLRADIHTLFDLYLLSIEPENHTVVIAPVLQRSCYADLAGKPLQMPQHGPGPDREALTMHYHQFLSHTQTP